MNNILVTGSSGQLGSELVPELRRQYGDAHVIAADIKPEQDATAFFEQLDVTGRRSLYEIVKKYAVDTIVHLAALLSVKAEQDPIRAWELNMGGLMNALEIARELGCRLFMPSSIGVFGPETPKDGTPQVTVQRPVTMYGIGKVAGELLCDYYHHRYGVDTRGLRFPGLISYRTAPGGGTTDYAVEMYFAAAAQREYACYIGPGTAMDMMFMPDAVDAVVQLMEADPAKLQHRNAYNVSAFSADPEAFAAAIRIHLPDFRLLYRIDPVRQRIAESWPNSIDTTTAEAEWGFKPRHDLASLTREMLDHAAGGSGTNSGSQETSAR